MTITEAARQREDFLARLDAEMQSVPHGVATEIRGGIAEELEGLDAEATAARIAQLGDPAVIAREAQAAVHDSGVPAPAPAPVVIGPRPPTSATKGFAIVAALTLSFGGIIVPAVGWVVGAVMVCVSPLWKSWEKAVAIVIPFVVAATVIAFGIGAWFPSAPQTNATEAGSAFAAPDATNPLVPTAYDFVWSGVFGLGVLLIPASGLWLLWRLRRR